MCYRLNSVRLQWQEPLVVMVLYPASRCFRCTHSYCSPHSVTHMVIWTPYIICKNIHSSFPLKKVWTMNESGKSSTVKKKKKKVTPPFLISANRLQLKKFSIFLGEYFMIFLLLVKAIFKHDSPSGRWIYYLVIWQENGDREIT